MNSTGLLITLAACLFITVGCSNQPKEFTEKRLIIASKETAKVNELDLSITNNGCGRKWIAEQDKPSYERAYCGLVVKMKDSTYYFGESFSPLYIKNLKLVVDKMNPWGSEEDSVPPGGCRIIITKLADLTR